MKPVGNSNGQDYTCKGLSAREGFHFLTQILGGSSQFSSVPSYRTTKMKPSHSTFLQVCRLCHLLPTMTFHLKGTSLGHHYKQSITMNKTSGDDGIPVELFQTLKRWCCESAALNMPANLENSAVATGLEKISFRSNLKERQCQRMLNLLHNCTHLTR